MWLGGDILPGLPQPYLAAAQSPGVAVSPRGGCEPQRWLCQCLCLSDTLAEVPIPKFLSGHQDVTSFSLAQSHPERVAQWL